MILAIETLMNRDEYEKLREERDRLVEMRKSAKVAKHRVMVDEKLMAIRERIKNAHRERNRET